MWESIVAEGNILDGRGRGAHWAPTTKANTRKAYGYWLHWLDITDHLDLSADPLDRLTPKRIGAYINNLDGTVASSTIFTYILDLLRLAKAVTPDKNWAWLYNIKNRLWARAKPARDKTSKIRSSADLFRLGLSLMEVAEQSTDRDPLVIPQRYQSRPSTLPVTLTRLPPSNVVSTVVAVVDGPARTLALFSAYMLRSISSTVNNGSATGGTISPGVYVANTMSPAPWAVAVCSRA